MAPSLRRRFRGYDRAQTDDLITHLTGRCDALTAERDSLNATIEQLRAEQREHERHAERETNDVLRDLTARERQISDLERELRVLGQKHEQQAASLERARDELSRAGHAQQRYEDERLELLARVGRVELRERVLIEQLTILKGELQQTRDPREALDSLVETVTQEARREAELTLKEARTQAEQIVRSAEKRGRELEAAVELRTAEDLRSHLGEALWTARRTDDPSPTSDE